MTRFYFAALLLLLIVVSIFCFQKPITSNLLDRFLPMKLVDSDQALKRMVSSTNAMVVIKCDWSPQSRKSQGLVSEFAGEWAKGRSKRDVEFYIVDLTHGEQDLPQYIQDWLSSDAQLNNCFSGDGIAYWMENGTILKAMPIYDKSIEFLMAETENIFDEGKLSEVKLVE